METGPQKRKRPRPRKSAVRAAQRKIIELFGKIDYDPDYDYKRERERKPKPA